MNQNYRRVRAEFGPETKFELRPAPPAPFRADQENRFERLRTELLTEELRQAWEPALASQVRRAANEAAALAWVTPYPILFFPALFEEKLATARAVAARQGQIRLRSRELLVV